MSEIDVGVFFPALPDDLDDILSADLLGLLTCDLGGDDEVLYREVTNSSDEEVTSLVKTSGSPWTAGSPQSTSACSVENLACVSACVGEVAEPGLAPALSADFPADLPGNLTRTVTTDVFGFEGRCDTKGDAVVNPICNRLQITASGPLSCSSSETEAGSGSQSETKVNKRKAPEIDWKAIEDPAERRKQRRLAKNRVTAARSRERKKEQWSELEVRLAAMDRENYELKAMLAQLGLENANLREQLASFSRGASYSCVIGSIEPAALTTLAILLVLYCLCHSFATLVGCVSLLGLGLMVCKLLLGGGCCMSLRPARADLLAHVNFWVLIPRVLRPCLQLCRNPADLVWKCWVCLEVFTSCPLLSTVSSGAGNEVLQFALSLKHTVKKNSTLIVNL